MKNPCVSKYRVRRALRKMENELGDWFSRKGVLDEIKFLIERLDTGMFDC